MRVILFVLAFLFSSLLATAQEGTIVLKNEKTTLKTGDFYIISVKDERKDTTNIGYIRSATTKKKTPVQFEGGVASALYTYFTNNIEQNPRGTPLELVILDMNVTEKKKKATITAKLGFRLRGGNDPKGILQTQSFEIETAPTPDAIEKTLRKQTERSTTQFDKWFTENQEKILAKPSITVTVTVATSIKDKNIIMHTKRKKLTYSNFQGRSKKFSKWGAETASGIYWETKALTIDNKTFLKLKIGSSFDKKRSWFKKTQKNPYVLDHEQLHFDVTSYITCEFIKAVEAYPFTPEHYLKELEKLYKQYNEKLRKMQDDYDGQTDHGLVKDKQAEWRAKINELMAAQDCYK